MWGSSGDVKRSAITSTLLVDVHNMRNYTEALHNALYKFKTYLLTKTKALNVRNGKTVRVLSLQLVTNKVAVFSITKINKTIIKTATHDNCKRNKNATNA